MDDALDPTQWPRYVFHISGELALVQTPEEEKALGRGWRREQWSDEAKAAHAMEARKEEREEVATMQEVLETPVEHEVRRPTPAPKKRSHHRKR